MIIKAGVIMNYNIGGNQGPQSQDDLTINPLAVPTSSSWMVLTFSHDTLSSSDNSSASTVLSAETPILPKASLYHIVMAVEQKNHDIAIRMLDQWNASIQEESARRERELRSPEYAQWRKEHSATAIAERERQSTIVKGASSSDSTPFISSLPIAMPLNPPIDYSFHSSLSAALSSISVDPSATALAAARQRAEDASAFAVVSSPSAVANVGGLHPAEFLLPSLIMSAASVPLFQLGAAPSALQIETNTLRDAWKSLIPEAAGSVMVAIGGWFSALWGVGLLYRITADNLIEAAKKKEAPAAVQHIEFAKMYAQKLLASLNDPSFMRLMVAMAARAQETTAKLSPEELAALAAKGKVVLLATALALIAKLELGSKDYEGYISEPMFRALIDGQEDLTSNDIYDAANIKHQLLNAINEQLNKIPAEAMLLRSNLLAYMASNPSIEKLLDQQEIFNTVFARPDEELNRQHSIDTPA
jgi:hypothetical protein